MTNSQMFTTSFLSICYSAILISNPAERWQRVHMKMARLVTGKWSRQQARSRTLDIVAGNGIPLFTGRDRKQSGLPSSDDTQVGLGIRCGELEISCAQQCAGCLAMVWWSLPFLSLCRCCSLCENTALPPASPTAASSVHTSQVTLS